jgi:hypothetical protein
MTICTVRSEEMIDEEERDRFSRVSANAVAVAMQVARDEMPEASEKRRLVLIERR